MTKLAQEWKKSGVEEGDTLLIQANCVWTMHKYKCKPIDILHSFLEAVGPKGTLLFPTFMRDYNEWRQNGFDIKETPSRMGVLSETARQYPDSVRSGHPLFSFVALGSNRELFDINNLSGYGEGSPFSVLRRLSGKIGVLGLPNSQGNTFFHHVEEMLQVPYRFYKEFRGKYTDWQGNTGLRTYKFYCRRLENKTLLDPVDDLLWKEGFYKGFKPYEGNGLRIINTGVLYRFTEAIIKAGKAEGLLYKKGGGVCVNLKVR